MSRPVQVASQAHLVPAYTSGSDDPAWRSVRVDSRDQKLDSFLVRSESSSSLPIPNVVASEAPSHSIPVRITKGCF